jgi:hypothetical protein
MAGERLLMEGGRCQVRQVGSRQLRQTANTRKPTVTAKQATKASQPGASTCHRAT